LLLGACTSCPLLRSDLEAAVVEIKDFKHKLDFSSRYTVLSPPCEASVSLKGKLFHTTKENTQLQQEIAYLTARLKKTVLSEKMVEEDLCRVEESATKSTYRLGVSFERCEDKGGKSATGFILSSTYHNCFKAIRSDNGTEFRNASFDEFCLEHEIDQQFSALHIPQQNGVVEQKNRTLVEMARTMPNEHRTLVCAFGLMLLAQFAIFLIGSSYARFCICLPLSFALVASLLSLILGLLDANTLF
jgi:hypothetical protein